jgi:integrase
MAEDLMRYLLYQTKKPDGSRHPKWRIKYFNDDGSYHSQETGAKDKRVTEGRAKNRLQELERARHDEAMGLTVAPKTEIWEAFAQYVKIKTASGGRKGRAWAKDSKEAAVSRLTYWINTMGWKEMKDIKLLPVQTHIADLVESGLADGTIATAKRHLKAFVRWAHENEILAKNPLAGLKHGQVQKKDSYRALTAAELVTLLGNALGERYLIYKGGAVTGLRASELCGLKVGWFDWARGVSLPWNLVGNKAKKDVFVEFPKDYLAELREYCRGKGPGDFVFNPKFAGQAAKYLQDDCRRLGIPLRTSDGRTVFHSLRHSFISLINALNPDLKTRLDVSRHTDVDTNLGYSHEADNSRRNLIEAVSMKLNSHKRVTWDPENTADPVNIGSKHADQEIYYSRGIPKPRISPPENLRKAGNVQLNFKGRPLVGPSGRPLQSHGSHMDRKSRDLEALWALLDEDARQSVLNHARGHVQGLLPNRHRKGVA